MRLFLTIVKFSLTLVALVALGIWATQDSAGHVTFDFNGWHIEAGFGFFILALLLLCLSLWKAGKLFFWIKYGSARRRERQLRQRQQDGLLLLTAGFNALASQDYRAAARAQSNARLKLGDLPLVAWLDAQIAVAKGDHKAAGDGFLQLTRVPVAATLGWRGLMAQGMHGARHSDSVSDAKLQSLLAAALADKRMVRQAALHEARFAVLARRHDFDGLRAALDDAARNRALPKPRLIAAEQALLLARAQALLAVESVHKDRERDGQARLLLERAYRLDPSFLPARLAYADTLIASGDRPAVGKLIAAGWLLEPSPVLLKRFETAYESETALARLQRFERFAIKRQDEVETQLALAQLSLAADLYGKAKTHAERAQALRPTARGHHLLGELALMGDGETSSAALSTALWHARQGADEPAAGHGYICQACHTPHARYHFLCDSCGAFATLVPATKVPVKYTPVF